MSMIEDLARWSAAQEGQFFERKSAYDRSGQRKKQRKVKEVAWNIAETLSAMANADGGELVVGMEDDGTVSGIPHAEERTRLLEQVPSLENYVKPRLFSKIHRVTAPDGAVLLHFQVDSSPLVHQLADGRYLLRIDDSNMPFPAGNISALKASKAQSLMERTFPAGATIYDIDLDLLESVNLQRDSDETNEDVLVKYRLAERRNGDIVPCLAGLLLFGKDPTRWHPRCGVDFVRWEGIERKSGSDLNIVKRFRLEHPLSILPKMAFEAIKPHIRERQHLHDLFFTENLEYPTFAWQEAIVNAVAHRDYSIQGAQIEVWMFDDRIEVRSPGLPPQPVTIEALNRGENLHVSRNPLMVRAFSDLGYMRELGEGIPRMIAEMEREGFYPPAFDDVGSALFRVVLRNQPVYDAATISWLEKYRDRNLSGNQKRLLAFAHAHGDGFTSRDYQKLVGLDMYGASKSIKEMISKEVVRSTGKGSRLYSVLPPGGEQQPVPDDIKTLLPRLNKEGFVRNSDVRDLLNVNFKTATRTLGRLVTEGWLVRTGERRGTKYLPGPRLK